MPVDYVFPTSAELELVAQNKMPNLMVNRPCFEFFPVATEDAAILMWEQKDNYLGLQQVRGINGEPSKVSKIGAKRYQMQPGVYGEYINVDEVEITQRRQWGSFGTPIDISDLVMDAQDQLLNRRLDRIESIIWTLLATGTFAVPGPTGAIVATDSYTTQQYTPAVSWATYATATPLADLRAIQLLSRGISVGFGSDAFLYMNRRTSNNMLSNTNQSDLAGRRTGGFGTFNSIAELNTLFTMDDLPNIKQYDGGYLAEGGVGTVTIAPGGTGYTTGNYANVGFTGGGGFGAAATVIVTAGVITSILITSAGQGYLTPPTLITTGLGAGTGAVLTTIIGSQFVPFIPDGTGILIGRRPLGQMVGKFVYTRNANNSGAAPGAYMKVIDNGERQVPRNIETHDGFNGGPVIYFPSSIVRLNV